MAGAVTYCCFSMTGGVDPYLEEALGGTPVADASGRTWLVKATSDDAEQGRFARAGFEAAAACLGFPSRGRRGGEYRLVTCRPDELPAVLAADPDAPGVSHA